MSSHLARSVEPFFRKRGECVLAAAAVVETDRGGGKKLKSRIAALVAPFSGYGDEGDTGNSARACICIMAVAEGAKKDSYGIRQEIPVVNLSSESPVHSGGLETLFKVSGELEVDDKDVSGVRVSFESSVQREIFSAAVRKAMRAAAVGGGYEDDEEGGGGAGGGGGGGGGPVSISSTGAAYGRERKREDMRAIGILPMEDEILLAKEARALGMTLNDVRSFEASLAGRIAETEAKAVEEVMDAAADWREQSEAVEAMREVVVELEDRVRAYSHELLSRRDVIQEIEMESTHRQRRKKNLDAVINELDAAMQHLRLPAADEATIMKLVEMEEGSKQVHVFFTTQSNLQALLRVTAHMQRLLKDPPPEAYRYAEIHAVEERAGWFNELRNDIATKAAMCVDVIATKISVMLLGERKRKSNRSRLILMPPTEVFLVLDPLTPLFAILRSTNYKRHCAAVRQFCSRLREVYSFETRRFFSELRRIIKRMGWRGHALLGESDRLSAGSRAKQMADRGELTPTPMLTPQRSRQGSENSSVYSEGSQQHDKSKPPDLITFGDNEIGVRLVHGSNYMPPTTDIPKREVLMGYADAKGGFMRPDMAFAAALKVTSDLVLQQRNFFMNKFGLKSLPRKWMVKLREVKERRDESDRAGSPTTLQHFRGMSDDLIAQILSDMPAEERDEVDKSEYAGAGESVTIADEVNVAMWEVFSSDTDVRVGGDTLIHSELLHTANVISEKCDGLHLLPCLALLDRMLAAIEDGDEHSSAPLDSFRRRKRATADVTAMSIAPDGTFAAPAVMDDTADARFMNERRAGFYSRTLAECRQAMGRSLHLYSASQIESINTSAEENRGRPALMVAFSNLPVLIGRLDTMISSFVDPPMYRIESFLRDTVHHLFDRLDDITIRAPAEDEAARKYAVFKQFLHHAFFSVMLQTSASHQVRRILQDFLATSLSRREHYEALYVTSDLFPTAFPKFASFMVVAEEARRMFVTPEDLRCHGALEQSKVEKAIATLNKELAPGVKAATVRLKKHFARAVPSADPAEDLFFRVALPVTYQHLSKLVQIKVQSFNDLVTDLEYVTERPMDAEDARAEFEQV
jgi:hypothetical protein